MAYMFKMKKKQSQSTKKLEKIKTEEIIFKNWNIKQWAHYRYQKKQIASFNSTYTLLTKIIQDTYI
jgi:hypothetical protein